jgi:hypothetical protein
MVEKVVSKHYQGGTGRLLLTICCFKSWNHGEIFPTKDNIVVELVPLRDSGQTRSRELPQWMEEQAIDGREE